MLPSRTLSAGEVAKALGVEPVTVRKWAAEGRIPSDRTVGGHRRFSLEEVRAANRRGGSRVGQLTIFLRGEIGGWSVQPLHVSIFGSIARGDDRVESDLDLLVVHPRFRSEKQRRTFGEQMVALHFAVGRNLDRDLREVELDLTQLEQVARGPGTLLLDVLEEGVAVCGTALEDLLLPIVDRIQRSGAA